MVKLAKPEIHSSTLKYQTLPKPQDGPWQFCVCDGTFMLINGLLKLYKHEEMPLCVALGFLERL